jgi:hypothetical protein
MKPRHIRVLAIACLLALTESVLGQTVTQRIRGDVIASNGHELQVKSATGQVFTVRLADSVRVSARSASNLASIKPGAFIGTTAVPLPDGTLSAVEVHIFPESMRGTGEGHRPMETDPGSTMTNATVTGVAAAGKAAARSTMTNATVATVAASGAGQRLTLTYKDGEKTVVVGDSVPIVLVEPGDASMLVPGAHVVVTAAKQPDGTLTSDRVSVGLNGLVPPI